jgi:5-(carboxyamino)imidazole ribonucleotide mutase
MVASMTTLPVIGVPIALATLDGMDSLLSIVQMPSGIPVATVGIGQAKNAGLLALRILSSAHPHIAQYLEAFSAAQTQTVLDKTLLH